MCAKTCLPRTLLVAFLLFAGSAQAQDQQTGVFYDWGALDGINFLSVVTGRDSYLFDNAGQVIHQWVEPDGLPFGDHSELTEQGTLLRSGRVGSDWFNDFIQSGADVIREYDGDGVCLWEFQYSSEKYRLRARFDVLPNGNVIATAWQNHPIFDARIRGYTGDAEWGPDGFWSNTLVEVPRTGHANPNYNATNPFMDGDVSNTCQFISTEEDLVWKWDSFDHMSDYIKDSYYNINLDFNINDIDYFPLRDHLMFVCEPCGEVFIIDHAVDYQDVPWKGHFIYRWGNSPNYGKKGTPQISSSGVNWVQDRFGWDYRKQDEGVVTLFNNKDPEFRGNSTIVQFTPPYSQGKYTKLYDGTYGPKDLDWKVGKVQERFEVAEDEYEYNWLQFLSERISFAQKLPNGNVLVTSSFEEVTVEIAKGKYAFWKYVSPFYNDGERDVIDTPDVQAGTFDPVPSCSWDPTDLCNMPARIVRYSRTFSGVTPYL